MVLDLPYWVPTIAATSPHFYYPKRLVICQWWPWPPQYVDWPLADCNSHCISANLMSLYHHDFQFRRQLLSLLQSYLSTIWDLHCHYHHIHYHLLNWHCTGKLSSCHSSAATVATTLDIVKEKGYECILEMASRSQAEDEQRTSSLLRIDVKN